ncbi:MAG: hypothetical protein IT290_04860 [Deltaproteobacteria bacterium]|nr:hypothetical protein [Deltaproteobacteria bacterium]
MDRTIQKRLLMSLALAVWAIAILFPLLGASPVFQVSEGREGVVVGEMLDSGDFILPLRNGEFVPSKPLLFHWIGAATATVLDVLDEFVLRFPSALAACGLLFALSHALRAVPGSQSYVPGLLLLLSMYGFLRLAQDGRVDMVFGCLVCAAIFEWLAAAIRCRAARQLLSEIPNSIYLRVALLCGLAVLAKGPLGIVLPLLVILSIAAMEERMSGLLSVGRWHWLIAPLLAAPWYVLAAQRGSDAFVGRKFYFENLLRFVGGEGITPKPFWFYIPHFFSQTAPWGILFLLYLGFLARGEWNRRKRGTENPFLPRDPATRLAIRAGLVWIAVTLLFLSLSAGKRRGYLLPVLPAVAFVLALRMEATWRRLQAEGKDVRLMYLMRYELFSWGVLVWLLGASIVGGIFYSLSAILPLLPLNSEIEVYLSSVAAYLDGPGYFAKVLLSALFLASIALWFGSFIRRRPLWGMLGAVVLVQALVLFFATVFVGVKGVTHTYRDYALTLANRVPADIPIHFIKLRKDESFDGFFFYLRRHVHIVEPNAKIAAPGMFLARRKWVESNREAIVGELTELLVGGRQVDEPEEQLVLFTLQ